MATNPRRNEVGLFHRVREVVRERTFLGIFKKQEILSTTTIGYDLRIETLGVLPDHIYVNGVEIIIPTK